VLFPGSRHLTSSPPFWMSRCDVTRMKQQMSKHGIIYRLSNREGRWQCVPTGAHIKRGLVRIVALIVLTTLFVVLLGSIPATVSALPVSSEQRVRQIAGDVVWRDRGSSINGWYWLRSSNLGSTTNSNTKGGFKS